MGHDSTRNWRRPQLSIYLLLFLISQSLDAAVSGKGVLNGCSQSEYWNDLGFCCDKCHEGFRLKQECSASGQRSLCEKCGNGTYMNKANYSPNCFRCTHCRRSNMVQISSCTFKSDSVCGCVAGYYLNTLAPTILECKECKKCGSGQLTTANCTKAGYSHCTCKEKHYQVKPNFCEPCVTCHQGCDYLCSSTVTLGTVQTTHRTDTASHMLMPVFACILAAAVGMFFVYEGIRIWRKKKRAQSTQLSTNDTKTNPDNKPITILIPADTMKETVPLTNTSCETEQCKELPDCIPREIKLHEFFYFILDEIPVGRFKELVRRLGISEQDIERAERDHRAFKDAQYQMLKIWSDRSSGGGKNVLPSHLIHMFLKTLRDMYLASCADNIENKYLS